MIQEHEIQQAIGSTAYDRDGDKIGRIGQIFLDDETGQPEFATVNTGLFGTNESYVPVVEATFNGDRVEVPYTKDQVKGAPNVDVENGHLDESEEGTLYDYYGIGPSVREGGGLRDDTRTDTRSGSFDDADDTRVGTDAGTAGLAGTTTGTTSGRDEAGTVGHDTSGPSTDDAMTRSEERLDVGTQRQETGRARLRKYVTTEEETVTVPVRKERAVVETEPVTDANRGDAVDGPDISEEEHEVVLSEERPVVGKTTEPVERVRLGTEEVTDEETVSEQVRKEHIEVEGDVEDRRGR